MDDLKQPLPGPGQPGPRPVPPGERRWSPPLGVPRPLFDYLAALAAVVLCTVAIGLILQQVRVANASVLYLVAVLAVAVAFGRGPAILAAVAAFLAFDFFFVQPFHTLTIADPDEWLSLVLFLLVAAIVSQLAAGQRQRAHEAAAREREATLLYDVVRLMEQPELEDALAQVVDRLLQELPVAAVTIEIAADPRTPIRIAGGEESAIRLLKAEASSITHVFSTAKLPPSGQAGKPGRWVRVAHVRLPGLGRPSHESPVGLVPIHAENRRVGALLLAQPTGRAVFTPIEDRLLSAVAAQLGLLVERRRLRQEATETEILRRTDDLRRALMNAVSHDLRTPLASIVASAGSLRQRDVEWTEDERWEFAQAIEEEAQRLNRIVGNLLDLSRIEAGMLRPEKGWYDLGALVDDVFGRLRPVTQRHRIVTHVPDDLPPLWLDYVEIDQVLSNLVENAVKYAPPDSGVHVSVSHAGGEVQVVVSDRGPGVPSAALPYVFDPFYRVAGGERRPGGLGLGLAVARGLIEAHGGRIWAENRTGGGSTFAFTLPVEQTAASHRAPQDMHR